MDSLVPDTPVPRITGFCSSNTEIDREYVNPTGRVTYLIPDIIYPYK
jgi:hypothetical protein